MSHRSKLPRTATVAHASVGGDVIGGSSASCAVDVDLARLVLCQLKCPIAVCTSACLSRVWRMAANHPEVWSEIDIGDAVRRYVAHHRSFARDNALACAAREALSKLSLFRAFVAWRSIVRGDSDTLPSVWARPSGRSKGLDIGPRSVICDVTLDTQLCTLGFLIDTVLRGLGHEGGNVSTGPVELICGTAESFESGAVAYANTRARTLADLGIVDGSTVDVDDDVTDFRHHLIVHHQQTGTEHYTAVISLVARREWLRSQARMQLASARLEHGTARTLVLNQAPPVLSPEAGIFAQDSQSCDLANTVLLQVLACPSRLSQVKSLDLRELGMGIEPLEMLCNASLNSLKTLNLDRCRLVDSIQTDSRESIRYRQLRRMLTEHGVSVSDVSDMLAVVVRGVGTEVHFRIRGRMQLSKLMSVFAQRSGGGVDAWSFIFRPEFGGGVKLKGTDTAREIGIPDGGIIDAMVRAGI